MFGKVQRSGKVGLMLGYQRCTDDSRIPRDDHCCLTTSTTPMRILIFLGQSNWAGWSGLCGVCRGVGERLLIGGQSGLGEGDTRCQCLWE
jgi:hypothetical protein